MVKLLMHKAAASIDASFVVNAAICWPFLTTVAKMQKKKVVHMSKLKNFWLDSDQILQDDYS